jgi:hypothetical protein
MFTPNTDEAVSQTVSSSPVLCQFKQNLPRLQSLGIIWLTSLSILIANSIYVLRGGTAPTGTLPQSYRLLGALIHEITSLVLLWYVMSKERITRKHIGWNPSPRDIPQAVGLVFGSLIVTYAVWVPTQLIYRAYSGQYLTPKSLTSVFGFGVSALSVAFICVNPFFEELVVRAFTMSEIMDLGGSRGLAIGVSVAIQISYHLYQGAANVLVLIAVFTLFSIYYAQTRNIVPVIVAHLWMDLIPLFTGKF